MFATPYSVRHLPMFAGEDGRRIDWATMMDAIGRADVVIVGEQHDDAIGHAVQAAIAADATGRWPGTAISFEMLERDEQDVIEDFREGIIDADTLAALTNSESWAGEGSWAAWYQPILNAAQRNGSPIIAANAPRRYVRLARSDGYERLGDLPKRRRAYVHWPRELPRERYWERFAGFMTGASSGHGDGDDERSLPQPGENPMVESLYRAQMAWDATMAQSMVRALKQGAPRVIHMVGQFHSDFEGGTVQQVKSQAPGSSVLTISMQRAWPDEMRPMDAGRADVIIYTGARGPGAMGF